MESEDETPVNNKTLLKSKEIKLHIHITEVKVPIFYDLGLYIHIFKDDSFIRC